jgi:hypothetical protein
MAYDYPVDRVIREEAHCECFGGSNKGIRKVVSDPKFSEPKPAESAAPGPIATSHFWCLNQKAPPKHPSAQRGGPVCEISVFTKSVRFSPQTD